MKKFLKLFLVIIICISIFPISTLLVGCNNGKTELTGDKVVSSANTLLDNAKTNVKSLNSNDLVNNSSNKKVYLTNSETELTSLKSNFNGIFYMCRTCLAFLSAIEHIDLDKTYKIEPDESLENAATVYVKVKSENNNRTGVIIFNEVVSGSTVLGKINVLFDEQGIAYELRLVGGPTTTSGRQIFVGKINTSTMSIISCSLSNENVEDYITNFNLENFTSAQAIALGSSFMVGYVKDNSFAFLTDTNNSRFENTFSYAYNIVKDVKIDANLIISNDDVDNNAVYGQDIVDTIASLRIDYV